VSVSTAPSARGASAPAPTTRLRALRLDGAGGALLLALGFIALTALWLSQDARVPDWDSGDHIQHSIYYYAQIDSGHISEVLKTDNPYPPVVELVGALAAFIGGLSVGSIVLTQNIVFVPLLVLGCYGTGRLVAGRTAGLLAVVFALSTPILVSEFHEFFLDPGLTAMVAVTVWLLLASDGFRDQRYALWAGGAAGVGMLTKQTFVFYIVGVIAVMLVRGGWRHWRHVLAFGGIVLAVSWGYYVYHFNYLHQLSKGVIAGDANSIQQTGLLHPTPGPDSRVPPTWSIDNTLWYFWVLVNTVLRLPYALLFAGGTVASIVGFVRNRRRESLIPELVGGVVIAWFLITYLMSLHDPRYLMPILVYAAVLGTAWIVLLPRRWRLAVGPALGVLAVLNVASVSFGLGSRVALAWPGTPERTFGSGHVTLYSPQGWLVGAPEKGGDIPAIVRAQKRRGIQQLGFESGGPAYFNSQGLWALAELNALPQVIDNPRALTNRGLMIFTRPATGRYAHPCLRTVGGTPVFFAYGGQNKPLDQWALTCPRR
jgi:4-amino-4-deoxy-L-arabinose transferase-like glycosyltransferase